MNRAVVILLLGLLLFGVVPSPVRAEDYRLSRGQTVYVPVYANIFTAPRGIPFPLAVTLSIRNTDLRHPLAVTGVELFDTGGARVRTFTPKPASLKPLESTYIFIPEQETTGGAGANFIVRWRADREINTPLIEALMIGTRSGQGISFVMPGQVIREEPALLPAKE